MTHEQLSADVRTFRGSIYRLAFGCTGNRFDADDVAQETFLKLYECKKDFKDAEHKKAFLIRVAINLCKNLKKSSWHKNRAELDEDSPASGCFNESERVLREYIMRLKPAYRAVIYLYYYEGYSAAEVAKILKITETAVTTRLDRARGQLKTLLINDEEVIS